MYFCSMKYYKEIKYPPISSQLFLLKFNPQCHHAVISTIFWSESSPHSEVNLYQPILNHIQVGGGATKSWDTIGATKELKLVRKREHSNHSIPI